MNAPYDVICIGAGPTGLACAIEAKRAGMRALVIDKGVPVQLALPLSREHGFLHHAGTARDRRSAVGLRRRKSPLASKR